MIFRQLFDHESSTYTYLVGDAPSGEAILIDPVLGQEEAYLQLLAQLGLTLKYAVDTHVHADHVTALGKLRERTGARTLMGKQSDVACASDWFGDGDVLAVGQLRIHTLFTPGHTDDSYCFYLPGQDMLFTGDTLLIRGTGRTDFQNGDARAQYESLQRLLALPGHTQVWPGHDYKGWTSSTLAEEQAHNPRLQVANSEAYAALMANLKLPNPKMMDVAVPANKGCGMG
ncbi:MBL fold metallo-hydrolase [Simiduia sp. 21SJ11W-1]|uniref:MBL fold metallo-hydrolase n=1 Tax=Simiduia sp. 21SJ11W-1 TaxID=2909669 RepID=UPI00209F540A|nr:MBL fold metallo-hydrolase [Simiduia sp. 21SJ11W-1]UTA48976.1 MBL fold metallo-hydrolase [Simiduia sp. 21SJ11W-1]